MKKTLQKIANLLVINSQNITNVGLLNGKTGVTIFLYQYSRYASQSVYSDQADDLLDELFASLKTNLPYSLADGVAGVGYGLNYLIQNRFIETDESLDELFKDVDSRLLKDIIGQFVSDIRANFPLFSAGFYALSRIKAGKRSAQKNELISSLLKSIATIYAVKKLIPNSMFTYSVIHFLISIYGYGIYKEKVEKTLKTVLSLVLDTFPDTTYRLSDINILKNSLSSIKLCPKLVRDIFFHLNQLNPAPTNNGEDMDVIARDLQQYAFYPGLGYPSFDKFSIEKYLDKQVADSSYQNLLPLSYMGLNIMGVKLC